MAASTFDRNTLKKGPLRQIPGNVKTNEVIPIGVMTMVLTPSVGFQNAADIAGGGIVMGLSCQAVNEPLDRPPSGSARIVVERGIFYLNNGGHITSAHVGIDACVVDNQTVDLAANTTNAIKAGKIHDVDSGGVWVDMIDR